MDRFARYVLGSQLTRTLGTGWPYGTFSANLLGGFCMGLLISYLAHRGGADQERWRLLLGVGVLGGFTTFSAFSLETALMIERRQLITAATYAAASVGYSLYFKSQPLVDVFMLAGLYTIRLIGGGAASGERYHVSLWLLAFSSFLFLSLAPLFNRTWAAVCQIRPSVLSSVGRRR